MLPLLYFYTVSFTDWFGDNIALLLVRRPTETNTICIAGIPLLPESILHFCQVCRFFYTFTQGVDSHGQYANLRPSFANKIWMPDIYIDQVKRPNSAQTINLQYFKTKAINLRQPTFFIRPASLRWEKEKRIPLFLSKALQLKLSPLWNSHELWRWMCHGLSQISSWQSG